MANVNTAGGARALPRPPKRPPTSALTNALAGQQAGGAKTPAVQPPTMVDLEQDPILQQIEAANLSNVQGAQAANTAGTKQALIDYGYEPGLDKLFPDQSTQAAAKGNPFSTLADLLYAHQQGTHGIDENLNRQNLFYSSERNRQLSDEEHNYQHGRSNAYGGLSTKLAGIGAALLAAQGAAATSNAQGASDAYARYKPPTTVASAPPPPGAGAGAAAHIGAVGAGLPGGVAGSLIGDVGAQLPQPDARSLLAGVGGGSPTANPAADLQTGSRLGLRPPAQIAQFRRP